MKILCIADDLIPADYIEEGFAKTPALADKIEIRTWEHDSIEALQHDNLTIEQGGPEALPWPREVFRDIEEFDAVVTQFCPVPAAVIAKAQRLRAIGVLRGGMENVDVDAARAQGVRVVNTPGRNAEAVAEFTVGMILCEMRNIARSEINLRHGSWERDFPNAQAIPEVEGKTVGVVGMGQIGRKVAKFVQSMGANIVFFDPMVPEMPGCARYDDLAAMAATCDVLSIHARLTAATHHLVSRQILEALPKRAILVNTARSGLVDEDALLDALQSKRIAGAAIDTFDVEPLPSDSRFLHLRNVTITAHLAGSTVDAFKKTPALLAPRLLAALKGE